MENNYSNLDLKDLAKLLLSSTHELANKTDKYLTYVSAKDIRAREQLLVDMRLIRSEIVKRVREL